MPPITVVQDIARRASGLQQPALPTHLRANDAASRAAVRLAWKRWLRFGGGDDWRLLKKRIRSEGLRPSSLYQPARLDVLPDWCATLSQVMTLARGFDSRALDQAFQAKPATAQQALLADAPLADLFAPLLVVARQLLAAYAPSPKAHISDAAVANLELALLNRLAEMAGPCVTALFDEFKAATASSSGAQSMSAMFAALMPAATAAPRGRYQAFVSALWADGFQNMCTRFPVLARLLCQALTQWSDMVAEFMQRLAHDRAALASTFCGAGQLGELTRIGATLSDSHAGGRSVMKVTFESLGADGSVVGEVAVAYKPRPSELEAAFSAVLDWFNALPKLDAELFDKGSDVGLPTQHRIPRMVCGTYNSNSNTASHSLGYGWMEWIAAAPMADGQQAAYHWRLGSLIGLYRALSGIDLHLENAVAAGAYPVLVDVECLLHPSSQPFMQAVEGAQEVEAATASALVNMAALPIYGFSSGGIYSLGLFGNGTAQTGPDVPNLGHANTDWMTMRRTPQDVPWQQLPHTSSGPVDAKPYAADVAAGYRATLAQVLAHRGLWLTNLPAVQAMRHAQGRHLARTTSHYGALLNEAVQPGAQSSGVLFDLSFEALHRHIASLPKGYQAMAPAERDDLRQLDVPRFMFEANSSQVLSAHGKPLGNCHVQTPYDRMAAALLALTPEQVQWESDVLAHALRPPAQCKGQASALAAQHLRSPDGKLMWFSLTSGQGGSRVQPLGLGLYAGNMGIALALASAGAAHHDTNLQALAVDTLSLMVTDINKLLDLPITTNAASNAASNITTKATSSESDPGALALLGPGLDSGVAGLLYGLQACAQLLQTCDAALCNSAQNLALRLASDARLSTLINQDKRLDLLGGNAGLLLALLSWHRAETAPPNTAYLQAALHCGQRIVSLAKREQKPDGEHLSWPIHGAIALSGLSHGGSGFAVAFAALYKATGDAAWLQSTLAALRHEATLYNSERLNWRDLRGFTPKPANEESFSDGIAKVRYHGIGWCHGAPGIALARAALLNMLGQELPPDQQQRLHADLDAAMSTNLRVLQIKDADRTDDLCCGSAGGIDILLECGRLLNRSDWIEQAQSLAQAKLAAWQNADAAASSPNYWYQDKTLGVSGSELGLFKGMAGWPYVAARVAAPNTVPCALLPLMGLA